MPGVPGVAGHRGDRFAAARQRIMRGCSAGSAAAERAAMAGVGDQALAIVPGRRSRAWCGSTSGGGTVQRFGRRAPSHRITTLPVGAGYRSRSVLGEHSPASATPRSCSIALPVGGAALVANDRAAQRQRITVPALCRCRCRRGRARPLPAYRTRDGLSPSLSAAGRPLRFARRSRPRPRRPAGGKHLCR